jgi:hypothetical protein
MYAIADSSLLYHLVNGRETYCGGFVTGERSQTSESASWPGPLYLVNEKPKDRILCKYCELVKPAMEKRRDSAEPP